MGDNAKVLLLLWHRHKYRMWTFPMAVLMTFQFFKVNPPHDHQGTIAAFIVNIILLCVAMIINLGCHFGAISVYHQVRTWWVGLLKEVRGGATGRCRDSADASL